MFNYPMYILFNVQARLNPHICANMYQLSMVNTLKFLPTFLNCTVDNSVQLPFNATTCQNFLVPLNCRTEDKPNEKSIQFST